MHLVMRIALFGENLQSDVVKLRLVGVVIINFRWLSLCSVIFPSLIHVCVCPVWGTQTTFLVSRGSEPSGGIVSRSTFALLLIIKKDSHKKEPGNVHRPGKTKRKK